MTEAATIRVAVIHDEPLTAHGIAAVLSRAGGFELVGLDARSVPAAAVVVSDYDAALQVLQAAPRAEHSACRPRVLVVTPRISEFEVRCALEQGVRGYVEADCEPQEIVDGVRALHRGLSHLTDRLAARLADSLARRPLTQRELDVLRMVAAGASNKVVARRLDISVGTVKAHLKNVLEKLEAATRTEASLIARRRGILQPGTAPPPAAFGARRPAYSS